MSGHSKWSTIKRKKGAKDAARSRVFTKLLKEITVSARIGGGDANGNPRLRLAVQKARAGNVPQDNIKKAIQKGTGELEGVTYEEIVFEGFGPGGVALLIECLTDNRNRAVNDVRHVLDKYGGHLGTMGAVTHLFSTHGCVLVDASKASEDALMAVALDAGAEDVRQDGQSFEILCAPAGLDAVTRALDAVGIGFESAEVARLPMTTVPLEGSKAQAVLRLMEHLEDVDDVQKVYANFDISEAEMAKLD